MSYRRSRRSLELHAARRVLRARHLLAQSRRHARERLRDLVLRQLNREGGAKGQLLLADWVQ